MAYLTVGDEEARQLMREVPSEQRDQANYQARSRAR